MFGSALAGYSRAVSLDPSWKEPPERERQLMEYLEKVTELIQNKVGKRAAFSRSSTEHNKNPVCCSENMNRVSSTVFCKLSRLYYIAHYFHNHWLIAVSEIGFYSHFLEKKLVCTLWDSKPNVYPRNHFSVKITKKYRKFQDDTNLSETTWWQQSTAVVLVSSLVLSLSCVSRGKWKHVDYGQCSQTSTHRLWVPARLPSSVPLLAAWEASSLELFPPSLSATMLGLLLWEKWCSAWPLKVVWPCKRSLF